MDAREAVAPGDAVPDALRCWFVIHGVVDWVFAIPLFLFPEALLRAFGWTVVDPMAARGVAAALVGIGTQSLLSRNATVGVYRELLSLKILWSFTATLGFAWTTLTAGPRVGWVFVTIFAFFNIAWVYWRYRLGKAGNEPAPGKRHWGSPKGPAGIPTGRG